MSNLLLPVLPLKDICLFPASSLALVVSRPATLLALDMASRAGNRLLALAQKDAQMDNPTSRDLHALGTLAEVSETIPVSTGGRRVELDGHQRARVVNLIGSDALVAEVEILEEGDAEEEWGPAVEALARYLHAHADLRTFLDQQRRSKEPMAWVNLACQHLPITATARQKLLEADARSRCLKISRGMDALLRKEKGD